MRASGCLAGAPLVLCERGILARLPDCFNQPIVGAAPEGGPGTGQPGGCAVLMHDVTPWLVPVTDEPVPLGQHVRFLAHMAALHAAFWDVRRRGGRHPGHAPLPGAVPVDSSGRGRGGHRAPGAATGGQGLAAAGRGGPGRGRGGHAAGLRPGPAGGCAGQHAADVRAQQLEAGQPGHRRPGPDRAAGLGAAGPRRGAQRPGLVPGHQLPPPAAGQGGGDRGLPGGAGGGRDAHRAVVGPAAGAVPARRAGAVRLGEGARRLRRGAGMVGRTGRSPRHLCSANPGAELGRPCGPATTRRPAAGPAGRGRCTTGWPRR